MRQKFSLHIEAGVAHFDEDDPKLERMKKDLNSKGIKASIKLKTPNESFNYE